MKQVVCDKCGKTEACESHNSHGLPKGFTSITLNATCRAPDVVIFPTFMTKEICSDCLKAFGFTTKEETDQRNPGEQLWDLMIDMAADAVAEVQP